MAVAGTRLCLLSFKSCSRDFLSIGGYAYSQSENTIRVNQYLDSRAELLMGANTIVLKQETQYPWDGDIQIAVVPEQSAEFEIKLRIPGWARNQPMPGNLYRYIDSPELPIRLEVNGSPVAVEIRDGLCRGAAAMEEE